MQRSTRTQTSLRGLFAALPMCLAAVAVVLLCSNVAEAQRRRGGGGGGGGFGPDRIFDYLDSNKDGVLDNDEIDASRFPIRDRLEEQGYDIDRGIERDDYIERETKRREEEGRGGEDGERGRGGRGDRGGDSKKKSSKSKEPVKRPPVTIKLPDSYSVGDLDRDGQIGLYEWRIWKQTELAAFFRMDLNGDGVVTPREIARVEKVPTGDSASNTASRTPRSPTIAAPGTVVSTLPPSASGGGFSQPSFPSPGAGLSAAGSSGGAQAAGSGDGVDQAKADAENTAKAKRYFPLLDKSGDGVIDSKEWGGSRVIRAKFEKAKIDISKPMKEDEFVTHYVAIERPE